jgi:hypothetical protein
MMSRWMKGCSKLSGLNSRAFLFLKVRKGLGCNLGPKQSKGFSAGFAFFQGP